MQPLPPGQLSGATACQQLTGLSQELPEEEEEEESALTERAGGTRTSGAVHCSGGIEDGSSSVSCAVGVKPAPSFALACQGTEREHTGRCLRPLGVGGVRCGGEPGLVLQRRLNTALQPHPHVIRGDSPPLLRHLRPPHTARPAGDAERSGPNQTSKRRAHSRWLMACCTQNSARPLAELVLASQSSTWVTSATSTGHHAHCSPHSTQERMVACRRGIFVWRRRVGH